MTIYTCLLPIVVLVFEVCHFIKHNPMGCDCLIIPIVPHLYLPATQYIICVFISIYLIPIILIILELNNNDETEKDDQLLCKIKKRSLKNILINYGNQFHNSFIGEIIHLFLYFVMIGIGPLLFLLIVIAFFDVGGLAGIVYGMGYMELNYIVPIVLALIFLYVLIRRISIYYARRIRIYKRQKDKRKETLERIRKNRQDNPPLPPEE